jgi:hypothetical protein
MTPSPAPPPQSFGPKLPVVALVLSVVGLCFPPALLITLALGLYGFLRGRTDAAWAPRKQITQMTMAVSGAGLLIFVGLFLPSFKLRQQRVKQVECRETLTSLHAAQARLYVKEKRYTTKLEELDWKPVLERAAIWLDHDRPVLGVPALVQGEVGVHGICPACSVTMMCTSQLDADEAIDAWTISTIERLGNRGEKIPGGIAWCEVDDIMK